MKEKNTKLIVFYLVTLKYRISVYEEKDSSSVLQLYVFINARLSLE